RFSAWPCWRATSRCGGATSEAANDSPPYGGNANASNVELLAQAFAGWGKDNPANMRDVLLPDCELVVPDSVRMEAPFGAPMQRPAGLRASCGGGSTSSPPRPRAAASARSAASPQRHRRPQRDHRRRDELEPERQR